MTSARRAYATDLTDAEWQPLAPAHPDAQVRWPPSHS
jgi:transposase